MSTINLEVVDVKVEEVPRPSGKGSYEKATVAYYNSEGKLESKTLFDWASKEVWPTIVKAKKGDTFSVDREKDAKGYWNWSGIARLDGPVVNKATPTPSKPTYETSEERQKRQEYIIRQSSIASAIALLGPKAKTEEVLKTADIFVNYVMQNGIEYLTDDPV